MSDEIKKLRNEVQLLRDELAIMQRKYEDILYNLDDENFSSRFVKEKGDMKTAIEVTAEGIKTKVSNEELKKYSTKEQTAEHIKNIVFTSAKRENAKEIDSYNQLETEGDKTEIYVVQETDDSGNLLSETYYYFNDITEKWEVLSGENIFSVFEQTDKGFVLKGNVKVDGSCVITDTLTFNSDSKPINVQYSTNGTSNWHDTFKSGSDKFMRIKIGSQWSSAMKVVGDDGQNGADGSSESVTFAKVNAVLGHLFKTANGGVPTTVTGSYIYSPNVLAGKFYGSEFYAGEGSGYSQMDEDGFIIYDYNGDQKFKIGYVENDYNYPYILLGQGTGWAENGSCCVYKFGSGIWIGDSCIAPYGGEYPGQQNDAENISGLDEVKNATGIFIDLQKDKIYKYIKGVPEEISSGGSSSGGCDGTCVAVFA